MMGHFDKERWGNVEDTPIFVYFTTAIQTMVKKKKASLDWPLIHNLLPLLLFNIQWYLVI